MRTLADFRTRFAPAFTTTPGTWRNIQVELMPALGMRWRLTDPGLQMDNKDSPSGVSPPASAEDVGLLVIAELLPSDRPSIAQRTLLRWHAHAVEGRCPVMGVQRLHELMVSLLMVPEEAARIDRVEMAHEFAAVGFYWKTGEQSNFEAREVEDLAKRNLIIGNGEPFTVTMLPGKTLHAIALWLAQDELEPVPHRTRRKVSLKAEA